MLYLIYGFFLGATIPYIARRFNKFMPATLGYALYKIIKPTKKCKKTSLKQQKLKKKYFYRTVLLGIITSIIFYIFQLKYGTQDIGFKLLFIWLILLLAEIDNRMMLLPDIITFPLALIGYLVAFLGFGFTDITNAIISGIVGYILPVVASLAIVWKNKDAFGGGDIKFLAVIGIWGGFFTLLSTIILASISFGIYSLCKRQRAGAFGPWLTYSTLLILVLFN